MLRFLIPVILLLVGLGGGVAAGLALRPHGDADETHADPPDAADIADTESAEAADALYDYVKLNNQFIVPVVEDGRVRNLVVLSLSLEVVPGANERVFALEPKLRDAFLRVLWDHANAGGFDGAFTEGTAMMVLRAALKETAIRVAGTDVRDVLISDLLRQDS